MDTKEGDIAVKVTGAYKKYGRNLPFVLNNLNMTVPKAGIYGLLGSSGCGKTTLLTSLTGFLDLDYGSIQLSINSRTQLGYMPQEIALFEEFTIMETFGFFARLYNLSEENFKSTLKVLKNVLDLPPDNQLCSNLSVGQARRVSIAVTILHSPEIIILDEPTSGLDPILIDFFWKYLKSLSSAGRTIIITTHYIEEARQADTVGLMRNGVLLAQSPPEDLITFYEVATLEDVFLKLCHKQNDDESHNAQSENITKRIQFKNPFNEKSKAERSTLFPHMMAVYFKIFTWIKTNYLFFIATTFLLSIFCVVGSEGMLKNFAPAPLGFVNHESGNNCLSLDVSSMNRNMSCIEDDDTYTNLGCNFVYSWNTRNPDMKLKYYTDMKTARSDADATLITAIIEIKTNFTNGIRDRMRNIIKKKREGVEIDIYMDQTDYMRTLKIKDEVSKTFLDMYKSVLLACGFNEMYAKSAPFRDLSSKVAMEGETDVDLFDYTTYVIMNVITGIAGLGNMILLLPMLSVDKMLRVFERCNLAGVKIYEILISYFIFLALYNMINIALMLSVFHVFYKPSQGPILVSYLLLNVQGLTGNFLGIIIVLVTINVTQSTSLLIVYILSMTIFSGFIWPVEGMFPVLRFISYTLFPNTFISEAYRVVEWKKAGITHPQVLIALGHSTCYMWIACVIIWLLIRKKNIL